MSDDLKSLKAKLLIEVNKHAVMHGDFVLTSGQKSTYYIDGKLLSLTPTGLTLLSKVIFEMIKNEDIDAVGGMTLGADPIIGGVVVVSEHAGKPLVGLIVRKKQKSHGRLKRIEGPLKEGMKVVVIEDVVTTGSSSVASIEALEEANCKIVKVITLVDRLAGGEKNITEKGYRFEPIFTIDDLDI